MVRPASFMSCFTYLHMRFQQILLETRQFKYS